MIRIALITAALLAGGITAASARDTLQLGVQGRAHGGSTVTNMLLYRHHLSRARYSHMRMMNRRRYHMR